MSSTAEAATLTLLPDGMALLTPSLTVPPLMTVAAP